jgi:ketosteroid isomerase-like protein
MIAKSPQEVVELLDRAFNEGDVEMLLAFYEDAAIVVTGPGQVARGSAELRDFFERVAQAGLSAKQLKTFTLEADGIALFLSRWSLHNEAENTDRAFVATTVFRRQPDGGWRVLIDNSFGPSVLGDDRVGPR